MKINKIKYNKLNNNLYKKLIQTNCIKNLKHINLSNNNKTHICYNLIKNYIKILNKPSYYNKLNYKDLVKAKKNLKSGYMILSTPMGIVTDKKALLYRTGGIILCYIK